MDCTDMEQRIEILETRLMGAEDQIDELNRTVWRQQRDLDLLRQHLSELARQIKGLQPAGSSRPEDEIPPHW
ncbi:MAG: SlyX family protein [Pseudazoarcus pumilus]|nr:SlyX family protein [Pseudazoarcus pumilus]